MKVKPPQIIVISFILAIVIGAFLLCLPAAVRDGNKIALIDSLFTATSATCVTGLVVQDIGSFFSPFGKFVILVLIQMGGLGIITFSTLFAIALGRKITIKENLVIETTLHQQKIENVKVLLKYIVFITLGFELLGAVLLFLRWIHTESWTLRETCVRAVFHSVSAFCNAGLSLFEKNFAGYFSDPYINFVIMALIVIGGIGFVVILDMRKFISFKKGVKKLNLQTKLAIAISAFLIILGALFIMIMEKDNVLSGFSAKERILASLFQSVTSRTAGFNTVDIGSMLCPTLLVMTFLMFIGASPGSTGGGIKTCTLGVLWATFFSMFRNKERVSVFRVTIPKDIVRKAIIVFFLALAWIFIFTVALLIIERDNPAVAGDSLIKILFEVTSAFGTVGLSTGITPYLSPLGKLMIIITMLVGRAGMLTAALSIAFRRERVLYVYPEEKIMVG